MGEKNYISFYRALFLVIMIGTGFIQLSCNKSSSLLEGISQLIPPTSFKAQQVQSTVSLTWTNPTIESFTKVILRRHDSTFPSDISDGNLIYEGDSTSHIDNTVSEGQTYYYSIFSFFGDDVNSEEATASITIQDVTGPASPTSFTVEWQPNGNLLKWVNPTTSDFDSVLVKRRIGGFSADVTDGDDSYSGKNETVLDDNITASTTYFYSVFAKDTANNYGSPVTASITVPAFVEPAWSMFMGDKTHQGRSPYEGPETPSIEWQFITNETSYASAVVDASDMIYISAGNSLYKLPTNLTSQSSIWTFTAGDEIRSTVAIGKDGTLFIGCSDHKLYALNPETGAQKWSFTTQDSIFWSSSAIADDGTLYVGSEDYHVYAVSYTGASKWKKKVLGFPHTSPVIGPDHTVYFGTDGGYIYALNSDGGEKWKISKIGGSSAKLGSPSLSSSGTLYIGSANDTFYAINAQTGDILWSKTTGDGGVLSTPAIGSDGTVYATSVDGHLYALNPSNGAELWKFQTSGAIEASPLIDKNNIIYIASQDGFLYAVNSNGTGKWKLKVDAHVSSPVLTDNGFIILGTNQVEGVTGRIVAVGE